MSDLVERLRGFIVDTSEGKGLTMGIGVKDIEEAAAEITRLTEQVKELEEWHHKLKGGLERYWEGRWQETEAELDLVTIRAETAEQQVKELERETAIKDASIKMLQEEVLKRQARAETAEANLARAVEHIRALLPCAINLSSCEYPAARAFVEEMGK